jgi:hypothetical protein
VSRIAQFFSIPNESTRKGWIDSQLAKIEPVKKNLMQVVGLSLTELH